MLHTPLTRAILSTANPLQLCSQISEKKTRCPVQDDKEQHTHTSVLRRNSTVAVDGAWASILSEFLLVFGNHDDQAGVLAEERGRWNQ